MQITNTITGTVDLKSGVITINDVEEVRARASLDPGLTRHYTNVLDTKEMMVRDALIAMGWTPPSMLLHSRREGEDAQG